MTFTLFRRLVSSGLAGLAVVGSLVTVAQAEVSVPNIFSSHMVLQQAQKNRVWGKAAAGEDITVSIAQQKHTAKADGSGAWQVTLDPLPVGGPYELIIKGTNEIKLDDVLVGEVWICSGQSNMQWSVNASNDPDLEKLAAKYPKLRMINFRKLAPKSRSGHILIASGKFARPKPSVAFRLSGTSLVASCIKRSMYPSA